MYLTHGGLSRPSQSKTDGRGDHCTKPGCLSSDERAWPAPRSSAYCERTRVHQSMLSFATCVPLVQTADGGWRPGIGDPTPIGWFTVVAYFVAAYYCLRAWQQARTLGRTRRQLAMAWGLLCLGMIALGINKQLDLQSLITVYGRRFAQQGGWYQRRRLMQFAFICTIALLGACLMVSFGWWIRRQLRDIWLAGLGATFLACFVVIRAASFHHMDILLGQVHFGVRMNCILELSGITCIAISALLYCRQSTRSGAALEPLRTGPPDTQT